jgi:hypothetical protein
MSPAFSERIILSVNGVVSFIGVGGWFFSCILFDFRRRSFLDGWRFV